MVTYVRGNILIRFDGRKRQKERERERERKGEELYGERE